MRLAGRLDPITDSLAPNPAQLPRKGEGEGEELEMKREKEEDEEEKG